MQVAFDIDDTIWKCVYKPKLCQVPDYDLIQVVRWFAQNGDEVFFWSAGGVDYCQTIIEKLGLDPLGKVIEKGSIRPHIAFDDCKTNLAEVDVQVQRNHEEIEKFTHSP